MDISKNVLKQLIEEGAKSTKDLERIKKDVAKRYKAPLPTNVNLLQAYHKSKIKNKEIASLLKTRPVRSLSGVVNVSILTKPYPCPGECIYCPTEKDLPKSYLDNEPAVMRAILNKYHPKKQIRTRIEALKKTGHPTGKIELRIVGGTWSYYPKKYKGWFIKECFDACLPLSAKKSRDIKEAQKKNESTKHRIVCLSVETRPDFIDKKEIEDLRFFGVTMVELGIQSLSDKILEYTKRGHSVKEIVEATKLLKDAGFKVCYQVMLNLPKSSPQKDIKIFREIFNNSDFRPDFLKIYPCLVLKNTPLYKLFKKKKHKAFSDRETTEVIKTIKKEFIPYYVRVQRIFRDIPMQSIAGGCKISNLRENIKREAKEEGWDCKCIRCREIKGKYEKKEKVFLFRQNYKASAGKEVFLTLENKERSKLYALLRLRKGDNFTVIREIHTYGQHLLFAENEEISPQHKGFGKMLIREAEKITEKEFKSKELFVIAGVGTRNYWRKLGYRLKATYMVKKIKTDKE